MKLRISYTLMSEMEPAIEDAKANLKRDFFDPSDPVYLKLDAAPTRKDLSVIIDADRQDVAELLDRAEYKIEVGRENFRDDPSFWRGQLAAWRALVKQIKKGVGK